MVSLEDCNALLVRLTVKLEASRRRGIESLTTTTSSLVAMIFWADTRVTVTLAVSTQVEGVKKLGFEHFHPFSTVQVLEHPSPSRVLLSSQSYW